MEQNVEIADLRGFLKQNHTTEIPTFQACEQPNGSMMIAEGSKRVKLRNLV